MGHQAPDFETTPEIESRVHDITALNRAWFKQQSPIGQRISDALANFVVGTSAQGLVALPALNKTLICDKPGMAFLASLPQNPNQGQSRVFQNAYVKSHELVEDQGVVHEPEKDRRTTGPSTFHVVNHGYKVPYDKTAVPREAASRILLAALNPPKDDMVLPFTVDWGANRAETFVSLLVNPTVVPGVHGFTQQEAMEHLILAPGGMISNLDFIERPFGNAGNQFRAENNLALNPEHWTGDTGVIIFAPHLTGMTFKELGIDPTTLNGSASASDRYNDGQAFLLKFRDESGVVFTIIADNYFGLGKKTIMTDVSFSADRRGLALQEHAGGAWVFPEFDLGGSFAFADLNPPKGVTHTYSAALDVLRDEFEVKPDGHAIDLQHRNHLLLNESARFALTNDRQVVTWTHNDREYTRQLDPAETYFMPNGMCVRIQRDDILRHHTNIKSWKLIGRSAEGTLIHKSDTVSGGGKSELSKPVDDLLRAQQLTVSNLNDALDGVQFLIGLHKSHPEVFKNRRKGEEPGSGRGALDPSRSLTSLVKLFTVSPSYIDEFNALIASVPDESKLMLAHLHMIQSSGEQISDWRQRFGVNRENGRPGKNLEFDGKVVPVCYMRLGLDAEGSANFLMLRPDYWKSFFLKQEDDLTASTLVPTPLLEPSRIIKGIRSAWGYCVRIIHNMEKRYFNRTDGAKDRGAEQKAERDIAGKGNFFTNFEPCPLSEAAKIAANLREFDKYTDAQRAHIERLAALHKEGIDGYFVASDRARILSNGTRSKNPRYMEDDETLVDPVPGRQAEISTRLCRGVPMGTPLYTPVDIIMPARRLNTTDETESGGPIPHIAIYPPLIMQRTPELIEDLICSVTGKSPSTTGGLGSEGAGTKGPFNCLSHAHYLNNQIRALVLSNEPVISTAAEMIGPNHYIGHDLSVAIKEVFARVGREELDVDRLLRLGYIAPEPDVEGRDAGGRDVVSKGATYYYFTERGMLEFFGRVFLTSDKTWSKEEIHPWEQNKDLYVQGKETLARYKKKIALEYFNDGSIDVASEPLRAVLHMMVYDEYRFTPPGAAEPVVWTRESPEYRALFTGEAMLKSAEYRAALEESQRRDCLRLTEQARVLEEFVNENRESLPSAELQMYEGRLIRLKEKTGWVKTDAHLNHILGSIGADRIVPLQSL